MATLLYLTWCWQSLALQEHGHSTVFIAHFKPDLSAQCIFLFSVPHNSLDSRTKTNQKLHEGLVLTPWWLQYPSYQEKIALFPSHSLLVLLGQENSLTFSATLERQMKNEKKEAYNLPDLFSYPEKAKKELLQPFVSFSFSPEKMIFPKERSYSSHPLAEGDPITPWKAIAEGIFSSPQ